MRVSRQEHLSRSNKKVKKIHKNKTGDYNLHTVKTKTNEKPTKRDERVRGGGCEEKIRGEVDNYKNNRTLLLQNPSPNCCLRILESRCQTRTSQRDDRLNDLLPVHHVNLAALHEMLVLSKTPWNMPKRRTTCQHEIHCLNINDRQK